VVGGADGDQFVIENNTSAGGDNQNGLKLSSLQTTGILLGGTATYQDGYAQLVADVGTTTRQTQISSEALGALRSQALSFRDSVSGVNLEEELVKLTTFQQSFNAASRLIQAAKEMSDVLIRMI